MARVLGGRVLLTKGAVLMILVAAAGGILAESSALSDAGNWAAIAAAAIAFLLLVGSIVSWLWSRWATKEIDHGLHATVAPVFITLLSGNPSTVSLRVGLNLINGSRVPLSFWVTKFDLRVGDWDNPLTAASAREDIAPSQRDKGWYRDEMTISPSGFPASLAAEFEVRYGYRARQPRRVLSGMFQSNLSLNQFQTADAQMIQPVFREDIRPTRDERLTWRQRHALGLK